MEEVEFSEAREDMAALEKVVVKYFANLTTFLSPKDYDEVGMDSLGGRGRGRGGVLRRCLQFRSHWLAFINRFLLKFIPGSMI